MIPKNLKFPLTLLLALALLIALVPTAQAASILPACVAEGYCTLCDILQTVINFGQFLLGIVGSLALLMFVYGGLTWLTSGGEPDKITAGKKILINSAVGLAITFFAYVIVIFVVNTLTASSGWKMDTELSCAPLAGLEPADPGDWDDEAKCKDDLTKPCNEPYTGATGESCIGKLCGAPVNGVRQVCLQNASAWACGNCKANDTICTDSRECCEGACSNGKCASSAQIGAVLGKSCNETYPCPSPFVCQTNWSNRCTYGKTGSSCGGNDSECQTGSFCMTTLLNVCSSRSPWALCEMGKPNQCPAGYTCAQTHKYCATGTNGCTNNATWPVNVFGDADMSWVCMPDDFKNSANFCVCDCDKKTDCATASYNGESARFCNTSGFNFCTPGKYASPCDENEECASNHCSHNESNLCTQGDVGEGCTDDPPNQCATGNKCYENVCVPNDFTPPAPPSNYPSPMTPGY